MEVVRYESAPFDTVEHNESMETFNLNGLYTIMENYTNNEYSGEEIATIDYEIGTIYHCKRAFYRGNILCKTDDPNAKAMIDLLVKSSCATQPLPDYLDTSQATQVQMRWGTICPTKEDVFQYKNYKFSLYGRYIYGYDQKFVRFVNKTPPRLSVQNYDEFSEESDAYSEDGDECSEDSEECSEDSYHYSDMESLDSLYEEEHVGPPNSLNKKEIILTMIEDPTDKYLKDYNYCFSILDGSNVLVAFALYR